MDGRFKVGDRVVVHAKGSKYEGIVMPSSKNRVLMLKLASGYNLGIMLTKDVKVKKVGALKREKPPKIKPPLKKNLPNVSIIATGGTITSRVDYATGGVAPLTRPEEVLLATPELLDIVNIKKISQPFTLASEDMTPAEWQVIAKEVARELNKKDITGAIVTHGTDTLHYTSAALSFMLKNLNKPVALVGGQRSSDRGSFDGALNLICAAHYCKSDIAEVAVVMHGNSSDAYCLASRGTNVRKMHASRRDAFRPINELPLAKIWPDGRMEIKAGKLGQRHKGKVAADTKFESKIALVKFFPGADPKILQSFENCKGIIIEATGLGHIATNPLKKSKSWLPAISRAVEKGIFVGFVPQTIYGRLDPYVYSNAREMLEAGACYLENMLSETAYVKLGWALARAKNIEETKKLMLTNIAGEIVAKILPETFLY